MKKAFHFNLRLLLGLMLLALTPDLAFAARSLGDLAGGWTAQAGPLVGFITVVCYGLAFFLGLVGGKMLYDKNKNQSAADPEAGKHIMAAFGAAVILAAIPEALGTGVMTVFGSTSNLSSIDGSVPQIR